MAIGLPQPPKYDWLFISLIPDSLICPFIHYDSCLFAAAWGQAASL